ncbi:sulfurtransferase TusA family protein [Synechococcus sp. CS-1325]|uniref:sulfurtransferase TusA family protein n=1 Tax=unclassified Synechococcus TaxID=2626047 RepID=UPI000DB6BD62|nr:MULTISPECIES: sulfurtransferase TusA family protein [unclassified Synechococcus]MCT0199161.1 sulfurtransferase TusA family protein [Synechococcus sp. CS-1325]MCT0214660.1 sulfurtransferase TusA family protein [Synechococcus sp. CS-1326]MCT0233994.1 sulfurtransferase TusA family protein [Synechococcus sp. CS-1327]PZU96587.1 MAG: sulfurtransferase TusA family protein [Cyanobium sp.]
MVVERPEPPQDSQPRQRLDLRGTPCPVNFIRSRLKLESVAPGAWLQIDLDGGEPERMVAEGLRAEGHWVVTQPLPIEMACSTAQPAGVRLLVCRSGA